MRDGMAQWDACRFSSTHYILTNNAKTSDERTVHIFHCARRYQSIYESRYISLSRICEISFPGLHRRAFISSFLVPLDSRPTFRYRYESKLESPAGEMSALSSKYEVPSWLMVRAVGSFFFFSSHCSREDALDCLP